MRVQPVPEAAVNRAWGTAALKYVIIWEAKQILFNPKPRHRWVVLVDEEIYNLNSTFIVQLGASGKRFELNSTKFHRLE